jgi:hypothetical protein
MRVSTAIFWTPLLSEHFDFSKSIPPIEYSYDRLHPFTFCSSQNNSKHHNTNMITFSLSLRDYVDEPFVPSPFHSFVIIHLVCVVQLQFIHIMSLSHIRYLSPSTVYSPFHLSSTFYHLQYSVYELSFLPYTIYCI